MGLILLRLLVLACLLLPVAVQAQEADKWEILFYDYNSIDILTADGITGEIELPLEAQGIFPFSGLRHLQLSPDHRYLLFVAGEGGEGMPMRASLRIADLVEGTCCRTVPAPADMQPDTITIGPFSPDGAQFVVNYAQVYTPDAAAPVLATIDFNTLAVVAQIDMMATFGHPGAFLYGWSDAGILLFPTCLACGGQIEGYASLWNPATGEITPQARYINFMGDRLGSTGEYLIPVRDESRPASDEDWMIPPANTIELLPDGSPQNHALVYFDPQNLTLAHPYWVADGRAYLLHNWGSPTATLVFRSGTDLVVDLPPDLHFIAATPDGWLMQRNESVVYHFQVATGGQVTFTEWPDIGGPVTILAAPVPGSAALEPVTPVIR